MSNVSFRFEQGAIRGGVKDIKLEASKTQKIRGQEPTSPEQTLSRPRTGKLEAKDQGQNT